MKDVKAISVVRPRDSKLAVSWVLDVWASGCHHHAGLGSADPEWKAIFSEPPPVPALGPTVPVCDRSDEMYDATLDKYGQKPRTDVRVLYCTDMVERAKLGMPQVVAAYLLYAYPRRGMYAPQYRGIAWSDEPAWGFIERGVRLGVEGFEGSNSDLRRFRKWLLRRERQVKDSLRGMIESEASVRKHPDSARLVQLSVRRVV